MGSPLWQKKNKTKQRCDYLRCIFLKARNDSFLSKRSLNIISSWFLPQNRKCKKCHFFYQNHGLTPLEDMEKCDYLKCIFLKARNDSLLYWTTFARHGDSFWKPSKSSLHLVLGLPRFLVCMSSARPERNADCPTVVCSSRQKTSPVPFEFAYYFHDIWYFGFFSDPMRCFTISPWFSHALSA